MAHGRKRYPALAAAAALITLAAACGSSSSSGSGASSSTTPAGSTAGTASASAAASTFVAIVQPPNPAYHRVGTAEEYTFNIDYAHLPAVPAAAGEGYVYVPGTPVAIWQ